MWSYLLRRILIFIPTLIAISLMAFFISINAPGDPVDRLLNVADKEGSVSSDLSSTNQLKQKVRIRLGLDLPVFYFTLGTMADPDSLNKIPDENHRQMILRLSREFGAPEAVEKYYSSLLETYNAHAQIKIDSLSKRRYPTDKINNALNESRFSLLTLMELSDDKVISSKIDSLKKIYSIYLFMKPVSQKFRKVEKTYLELISKTVPWKTFLPQITWVGFNNQYHNWVSNIILRGDFGISYQNQQPIMERIWDRFKWSFWLSILSVIIAYLVSIPIGIAAAYKKDTFFDRASSVVLFILYSLPNFFIGTLLLVLFANPELFNWFPESGVKNPITFDDNWPWWEKLSHYAPYLVLPLITYTYSSFAFLSRQMRVSMVEVINLDFIRTARAKGLPEKKVILKHALRNSLLPIITVFANIFPMAVGGSVIVETIFSIPGMGYEIYSSILNYDYPMIVAIFTIIGFLTLLGYLIADILYALVDPRISYK